MICLELKLLQTQRAVWFGQLSDIKIAGKNVLIGLLHIWTKERNATIRLTLTAYIFGGGIFAETVQLKWKKNLLNGDKINIYQRDIISHCLSSQIS